MVLFFLLCVCFALIFSLLVNSIRVSGAFYIAEALKVNNTLNKLGVHCE